MNPVIELEQELDSAWAQPLESIHVYASPADNPKVGRDGTIGKEWGLVGLLGDNPSVPINRALEENEVKVHVLGVIDKSYKPGDVTAEIPIVGSNALLNYVKWPDALGDVLRHTGKVAQLHFLFVMKRVSGEVEMLATRRKANATIEGVGYEQTPEGKPLKITFRSGRIGDIFDRHIVKSGTFTDTSEANIVRFTDDANNEPSANKKSYHVDFPKGVTGGTFDISVGDQKASGVKFDVTADELKQKLVALSNVTAAVVAGSVAEDFTITITTNATAALTVDGSKLTGVTNKTVKVS